MKDGPWQSLFEIRIRLMNMKEYARIRTSLNYMTCLGDAKMSIVMLAGISYLFFIDSIFLNNIYSNIMTPVPGVFFHVCQEVFFFGHRI